MQDGATKAQIAGIEVCVRATSEPLAPQTCATTDAAGKYEIAALAEGQYHASFSAPAESGLNYLTQYFKGRSTEALADPVSVAEGTTTDKVNASMQAGGEIKGTVTEGEDTTVAGIEVCALERGLEAPVRCIQTNASGEYTIAGLASGEYEVEFSTPGYVTQFYEAAASREQAKSVAVTAGAAAVEGVSAVLQPAPPPTGAIEGTVSSAATSAPLSGVQVCALSIASSLETCAVTDASGAYTLPGLAPGGYHVEFVPPEGGEAYEPQWYKEKPSEAQAEVVTVAAAATTGGVDARLQLATGAIAGTVTSAATKTPLPSVQVCAYSTGRGVERCAVTAASGAYTVAVLPVGRYTVHFLPFEAGSSYAPQFFENKANEADAEPVPVIANSTVSGIDAVLQGIPVAVLRPAIAGPAAEGQMLRLLPGTWTNAPTLTDEWGQCDAAGVIETCHTIATTPTYTPTAADVGCTIRIREQASNEFGLGTPPFLFSPPTTPVTTASGGAGACRPTPSASPAWSTLPATGVSPQIARAASNAQLKALLVRLLTPRGKGAKVATLTRRRGYSVSFNSLAAGRLSVAWYQLPKGARLARAKPVLVASGKVTTKASGATKLTIKLTAKGRRLLVAAAKRPAAKRLVLRAKGVLAPSGRPSLSATRSFTLKL